MKKLLLITGDIAAGKSAFSKILSERYCAVVFQKDTVKEILGDRVGFHNRTENKVLSHAAVDIMCHVFSRIAKTGADVILEANYHEDELNRLHTLAGENQYAVLTLVLRGDADVLYNRYLHRMNKENRHPVHLSTTLDIKEDFINMTNQMHSEKIPGKNMIIDASDFSYQENPEILSRIDFFMA